jgi:hypothetical protein
MRAVGLSGVFRGFAMRCSPLELRRFMGATSCNSSAPLVAEPLLVIVYLERLRHRHNIRSVNISSERWLYLLWGTIIAIALLIASPPAFHTARLYGGYLAFRIFVFRASVHFVSLAVPMVILTSIIVYICRQRFSRLAACSTANSGR